jgi:hypothetical protein
MERKTLKVPFDLMWNFSLIHRHTGVGRYPVALEMIFLVNEIYK